ncbi:cytochrome P450 [Irpex rosettiformis]|uniref:Cytochrome P450 n=1 Tax=Irpex rosettiformis TaxID=378272 RepID=A0ACB8U2M6_9APHY|nr:cytochrome P450 [Irpex rosettiformis]
MASSLSQNLFDQVSAAVVELGTNASTYIPDNVAELASTLTSDVRLASSVVVLVGVATWTVFSSLRRRHSPPGPPQLPIIGNVHQVPTQMPWIKFTEWSKQYGPIFSLNLLGQQVIVLNTHKAAGDLFDRRSNIYSDRPRLIMAGEILTGGIFMVFARYSDVWRKMRRASHESFNPRAVEKYLPIQAEAAAHSISRILAQPESWEENLKRYTASAILSSVYGWPTFGSEGGIIKRLHAHTARIASAVVPGAFLVDFFPFMKYFPTWIAKWKRDGLAWHKAETDMFEGFNAGVAEKLSAGEAQHSFVTELIDTEERHGLSKKEAAWLAAIMVSAGAETTSTTMFNFMLAMTLYPDVMRRAQAEIDAVVGRERVPTFDDKENLPFIRVMVRETLRWRPVGPLAVPRQATEDDWYEGYFIPKGMVSIYNALLDNSDREYLVKTQSNQSPLNGSILIWINFCRDPTIFPDFDVYRPDRFLDESGKNEISPPDTHQMGHVTYGFGRRSCVGLHFANHALFIAIATILWAADILPPVDENGNVVLPDANDCVDAGVVVGPAPFRCRIKPRFPEAQAILEAHLASL